MIDIMNITMIDICLLAALVNMTYLLIVFNDGSSHAYRFVVIPQSIPERISMIICCTFMSFVTAGFILVVTGLYIKTETLGWLLAFTITLIGTPVITRRLKMIKIKLKSQDH